jgi:hypothetical protein
VLAVGGASDDGAVVGWVSGGFTVMGLSDDFTVMGLSDDFTVMGLSDDFTVMGLVAISAEEWVHSVVGTGVLAGGVDVGGSTVTAA